MEPVNRGARIFNVLKGDKQFAEFKLLFARWHVAIPLRNLLRSLNVESQGISEPRASLLKLPRAPKVRAGREGRERFPGARPRIISDNGPQFTANDLKHFVRIPGMKHVRTSPLYPQSNGKIERYHRTIKSQCIRPSTPLTIEDTKRAVRSFVEHYNTQRLLSAIGYVTPLDMLEGRQKAIHEERDRKLEEARRTRAD
jgi:putative transposase